MHALRGDPPVKPEGGGSELMLFGFPPPREVGKASPALHPMPASLSRRVFSSRVKPRSGVSRALDLKIRRRKNPGKA
jgi:hypothetical protein